MATGAANTSTPDLVGWVAGPETRGTLTLVWSCVITIFACTWTVLHLN
ncbi:Major facilitator superfamily domain general substrate transporter protein [Colletotrichum scovillei]|uniref:Major facilitator superfamily domain general substrate transporter protein n=2 Tax=Colletotrichum scovillei TaxID=1209932 RepID=A0A9P7QUC6_9PEZI|nr:Major facilitator superfamily domain general substrate transporter protein [Colletotrichum scovillei]KAG7061313.1 Major facilitator superfamily domain general substrate transporter protein [Colletotrichum scovillei]